MVWGTYGELEIKVQPASIRYGFPKARIVEGDEMVEGLQELEQKQIEQDHAGGSIQMCYSFRLRCRQSMAE